MSSENTINELEDIKLLVDRFYDKVRKDALLAPVFADRISSRWAAHQEKMYRFWQTVLLEEHTYFGSPFAPHALLPVDKVHFDRWLKLFYETLDENFSGATAEEARWRAARMAEMFHYKITHYQNNSAKPIL